MKSNKSSISVLSTISVIMSSALLIACGSSVGSNGLVKDVENDSEPPAPQFKEEMRSQDILKLIVAGEKNGIEPSTFDQQRYLVGPTRRLLMAYSDLKNQLSKVSTADGGLVILEIYLANKSDAERAKLSFQVCPIISQWRLWSTWIYAHPTRRWKTPGGDFDPTGCVNANLVKPTPQTPKSKSTKNSLDTPSPSVSPTPSPSPVPESNGAVYFDVTGWYLSYPKGRGVNFGLLLKSDADIEVFGEQSGAYSPRIYWHELKQP